MAKFAGRSVGVYPKAMLQTMDNIFLKFTQTKDSWDYKDLRCRFIFGRRSI